MTNYYRLYMEQVNQLLDSFHSTKYKKACKDKKSRLSKSTRSIKPKIGSANVCLYRINFPLPYSPILSVTLLPITNGSAILSFKAKYLARKKKGSIDEKGV
jgi:hypothetical protein